LDLNDHVGGTGADRLDAIATRFQIHLANHFAVLDHQIAALNFAASDWFAGKHDHVLPPRRRAQQASDGTAARQYDLKSTRRVGWGAKIVGRSERKRHANYRADSLGAHAQGLAQAFAQALAACGFAGCPIEEPHSWRRFFLLSDRLSGGADHDQRERHLQAMHPQHRSVPLVCDRGPYVSLGARKGVTLREAVAALLVSVRAWARSHWGRRRS